MKHWRYLKHACWTLTGVEKLKIEIIIGYVYDEILVEIQQNGRRVKGFHFFKTIGAAQLACGFFVFDQLCREPGL